MSVIHIHTLAFAGLRAIDVDVQISVVGGFPSFNIVGLADKAVVESKERIRAALSAIGLSMFQKRVTINLSPASLPKQGTHYDLPIMLGLLVSMSVLPMEEIGNYVVLGELALDGAILPVKGILPSAIHAAKLNMGLICPSGNAKESILSGNDMILLCEHLMDIISHFKGQKLIASVKEKVKFEEKGEDISSNTLDLNDVRRQYLAKRALIIAAAGRHNLLMVGSPGIGKSMLAKRLLGLLPRPTPEEILENSIMNSISREVGEDFVVTKRLFRAPHHSCSLVSMVGGGGNAANPGEISLAHNGILFLDELAEFSRGVLDSLRQPIENKEVVIARAKYHVTFPANFQLIAAMNPCKCGYLFDSLRSCKHAPKCGFEYQTKKISGPLIDRFDLHLEISHTNLEIETIDKNYDMCELRQKIENVVKLQAKRYQGIKGIRYNSEADGRVIEDACNMDDSGQELLKQAAQKHNISMRGYFRIMKIARTIADLECSDRVLKNHISEALYFRPCFSG